MADLLGCAWRLLVVFALSIDASGHADAAAAEYCAAAARSAPPVPTILAAPTNTTATAWILHPDCRLDTVPVESDVDSALKLNCTARDIGHIESLPLAVERLCVWRFC
jgi:hypothetical protein